MLDHILGKPSANIRRSQTLGMALLAMLLLRRKQAPWGLQWLARWDRRVPAWKALIGWSAVLYMLKHMDDLLGLNAPEPLREYYSRSFYRTTWVFTALDAGFWTAMSIRPKPLRDMLSLLFSLYYLVFTNRGIEKVRKVRALITIDHLRVSWNKGVDNPLLRWIRRLHSSRLAIQRVVELPSPRKGPKGGDGIIEPAKCHVLYAKDPATFASNRHIVLNYPGGGFVSMGPECHMDYLSAWAERTGAVVVSVDYAKAPEYPYPYAIDQCYEVYRELVQTNGRCIGLDPLSSKDSIEEEEEPLRIVLAGDSAGGNITASVMFRILESPDQLRIPEGIVFIYGCFNVDIRAWMTRDETRTLLGVSSTEEENESNGIDPSTTSSSAANSGVIGGGRKQRSLVGMRDHLHHVSPLAVTNLDDGYQQRKYRLGRKKPVYIDDRVRVVRSDDPANSSTAGNIAVDSVAPPEEEKHQRVGYVPLTMTSSFTYFNDQILSPEMMRAMIIMYVGPNGRPNFRTDYYLSPIVAPDSLLERFPPVYFMCGEKDPMVDDTVLFAARIRNAKQKRNSVNALAKEDVGSHGVNSAALPAEPSVASPQNIKSREYRDYKTSKLYSRRHSRPPPFSIRGGNDDGRGSTQFYIGSTDVSDNDDDNAAVSGGTSSNCSSKGRSIGPPALPASLRMSQIPSVTVSPTPAALPSSSTTQAPRPVVIKVKLVAGMSHGFMQMYSLLPESKSVANTLGDWLGELLFGDHTITPYSRCASAVAVTSTANNSSKTGAFGVQNQQQQPFVRSALATTAGAPPSPPEEAPHHLHQSGSATHSAAAMASMEEALQQMQSQNVAQEAALAATTGLESPAIEAKKSIFDRGQIDRHGIEIVSAVNMVRRRGHGLADPLN